MLDYLRFDVEKVNNPDAFNPHSPGNVWGNSGDDDDPFMRNSEDYALWSELNTPKDEEFNKWFDKNHNHYSPPFKVTLSKSGDEKFVFDCILINDILAIGWGSKIKYLIGRVWMYYRDDRKNDGAFIEEAKFPRNNDGALHRGLISYLSERGIDRDLCKFIQWKFRSKLGEEETNCLRELSTFIK